MEELATDRFADLDRRRPVIRGAGPYLDCAKGKIGEATRRSVCRHVERNEANAARRRQSGDVNRYGHIFNPKV